MLPSCPMCKTPLVFGGVAGTSSAATPAATPPAHAARGGDAAMLADGDAAEIELAASSTADGTWEHPPEQVGEAGQQELVESVAQQTQQRQEPWEPQEHADEDANPSATVDVAPAAHALTEPPAADAQTGTQTDTQTELASPVPSDDVEAVAL